MERPKAHHFLPAAHLARFSLDGSSVQVRDRTVSVYSKRSGRFRRAKAGKLAFENDLYTFRLPVLTDVQPDPDQLIRAVLDPANKDGEIESMKAEIEEAGIAAMREIDGWQPGPRILSEDERQPLLSYAGLLLAQHPTMMAARSDALSRSFWNVVQHQVIRNPMLDVLTEEMHRGTSSMALIFDGLATALELNYLAWKIVRWPAGPAVILGDAGVGAGFSPQVLGVGDAWSPGAKFMLPISPTTVVVFGELLPGVAFVEERVQDPLEIGALSVIGWARSGREVYGSTREDLEAVAVALGPLDPNADHSTQLAVRESVLPTFRLDRRGRLRITHPAPPDPEETRRRFEARFPRFHRGD